MASINQEKLDEVIEIVKKYRDYYKRTNCIKTCSQTKKLLYIFLSLKSVKNPDDILELIETLTVEKVKQSICNHNNKFTNEEIEADRGKIREFVIEFCTSQSECLSDKTNE